ncbi:hypothetical protein PNIG_a2523 [Pseudoalteromonas nigrifaciens]|uniref:Uncharacterized protein n=1 Tax=Pseudoalteromonas nigrifaciens TaxID=28109 RepID=A0AAC9UKP9_9GAMM|nr:hypothetical protein PNIG_a2523 [Pseudoalteromonas nigrifaciens]
MNTLFIPSKKVITAEQPARFKSVLAYKSTFSVFCPYS